DAALQYQVALLVAAEAEVEAGADMSPALRRAVDDGVPDRVLDTRVVLQRIGGHRPGGRARPVPAVVAAVVVILVIFFSVAIALLAAMPGARAVAVAQERDEVARRREAEPQHHGVLRGVEQLVDMVRVEIALEADFLRARHAGERGRRAVGKGPCAVQI